MERIGGGRHAGMKPRSHDVIISPHAYGRWSERGGPAISRKKLEGLTKVKVNNALAIGLPIDHTRAGWVEVIPGLWAVVELHSIGFIVKTYRNRVEEKAG